MGLTGGERFARTRRAVEQDRKTPPFTAHHITKARFLKPICFHHSLDDLLVIIPDDQSFERFIPKPDRFEVIHLH